MEQSEGIDLLIFLFIRRQKANDAGFLLPCVQGFRDMIQAFDVSIENDFAGEKNI